MTFLIALISWNLNSERRRETRLETSCRSTQWASCYCHMGKQNRYVVHRTESYPFSMWNRYQWLNGTARPWRLLPTCFSNMFKDTNSKVSHRVDTDLKHALLNFQRDSSILTEVIAFFATTDFAFFAHISGYNSRNTKYFQDLINSSEGTFEDQSESQ